MYYDTDGWPNCCWGLAIFQSQLICEKSSWSDRSWHLGHFKEINTQHQRGKNTFSTQRRRPFSRKTMQKGCVETFWGTGTLSFLQGQLNTCFCIACVTMRTESFNPPPSERSLAMKAASSSHVPCHLSFIKGSPASLWLWVCDKAGSNKHTKLSLNVLLH